MEVHFIFLDSARASKTLVSTKSHMEVITTLDEYNEWAIIDAELWKENGRLCARIKNSVATSDGLKKYLAGKEVHEKVDVERVVKQDWIHVTKLPYTRDEIITALLRTKLYILYVLSGEHAGEYVIKYGSMSHPLLFSLQHDTGGFIFIEVDLKREPGKVRAEIPSMILYSNGKKNYLSRTETRDKGIITVAKRFLLEVIQKVREPAYNDLTAVINAL